MSLFGKDLWLACPSIKSGFWVNTLLIQRYGQFVLAYCMLLITFILSSEKKPCSQGNLCKWSEAKSTPWDFKRNMILTKSSFIEAIFWYIKFLPTLNRSSAKSIFYCWKDDQITTLLPKVNMKHFWVLYMLSEYWELGRYTFLALRSFILQHYAAIIALIMPFFTPMLRKSS